MLYKKYHRNFVSQFKKGTRVDLGDKSIASNHILTVTVEPIIELNLMTRRFYVTFGFDENEVLPLVFSSGRLMYYNVIQEIS